MTVFVFAGPTIGKSQITKHLDAVVLPPVAMGDLHRVAGTNPKAIGIIDGYFDGVPSVWHKEILWAISKGVPVYGAASMGALRAAELHAFGMHGIGSIFEAFRDGMLEDDDEVALHHGPAQIGYVALSEPMVNIRATLERASGANVVSQSSADRLTELAKSQYYPQRSWKNILSLGRKAAIGENQLDALEEWLPENRVDQKLNDAIAMLEVISNHVANGSARPKAQFNLEWTIMWDKAVRSLTTQVKDTRGDNDDDSWVLDELRLDRDLFKQIQRGALARFAVNVTNIDKNTAKDPGKLQQAITRFRGERALLLKTQLDDWLEENDIDLAGLERLIEGELQVNEFSKRHGDALGEYLLAELRLRGAYRELAARARHKMKLLEATLDAQPDVGNTGVGAMQLRLQFFEMHFHRPIPDDLVIFLEDNGFTSIENFDRMLAREYLYNHRISVAK